MYNLKDTGQPKRRNLCRLQDTPWKPGEIDPIKWQSFCMSRIPFMKTTGPACRICTILLSCYIKKGTGNYLIEDQNFPIKEDDFIIINSNTSHTERSVGEIPLEYIILGVEGLNFSFGGEHEHLIFNCRRDHEEFAYFMDSLLEEMENKRPHYELVCQDLLNMLIVKLIRRDELFL